MHTNFSADYPLVFSDTEHAPNEKGDTAFVFTHYWVIYDGNIKYIEAYDADVFFKRGYLDANTYGAHNAYKDAVKRGFDLHNKPHGDY